MSKHLLIMTQQVLRIGSSTLNLWTCGLVDLWTYGLLLTAVGQSRPDAAMESDPVKDVAFVLFLVACTYLGLVDEAGSWMDASCFATMPQLGAISCQSFAMGILIHIVFLRARVSVYVRRYIHYSLTSNPKRRLEEQSATNPDRFTEKA
ncbi:hypothetical protein GGS20DRAFT_592955 [Poronia punctata]|nr:hypothetical protein GGS20DRAFT_592955 [Poronia punctata]